jgi:ABC-type multidrug transport system fused ATPase/permease subunit
VIAPIIAVLVDYMSKAFRRYGTRIQNSMGDVTRVTEQSLHGHRIVKIFNGHDYERRQFDDINSELPPQRAAGRDARRRRLSDALHRRARYRRGDISRLFRLGVRGPERWPTSWPSSPRWRCCCRR